MSYPKIISDEKAKKFIKKQILNSIFVLIIVISLTFTAKAVYGDDNGSFNSTSNTIIIDAGHGNFDGGAVVGNVLEKDINLEISKFLVGFLKTFGFNIIQTRKSDTSTEKDPSATISSRKVSDLNNRLNLAKENKSAIFVSIHLNKFQSSSCKGAQIFYGINNEKSKNLAESIKNSIVKKLQIDNKRTIKKGTKDTFLLYKSPIPTVIVECGFMSNPIELKLLLDKNYQKLMAFSIFCGIIDYINT